MNIVSVYPIERKGNERGIFTATLFRVHRVFIHCNLRSDVSRLPFCFVRPSLRLLAGSFRSKCPGEFLPDELKNKDHAEAETVAAIAGVIVVTTSRP